MERGKRETNRERERERCFLRMIPALTQYPDIALDISPGYGISSGIVPDILSGMYSDIISGILPGIYSDVCFDIPSGILSDILFESLQCIPFGTNSDISSGVLSDICSFYLAVSWRLHSFWLCFWPSIRHPFLAFYPSTWHLQLGSQLPAVHIANCTRVINLCSQFAVARGQP